MPHILIVDDQDFVRETLCNLIRMDEPAWQLSEAANGKEALNVFCKALPEVVVLDIVMAGMNGVQAAYQMQQINPRAKIVFISSQYTIGEASGMARLLGSGFVQKSEAGRILIPTIKRLLNDETQPV